jgi:hypothetical protein
MVALAGFLCYEVTQRVPVILLDSVGGLAGEHLRRLVDYLESSTEAVVTTAYPEQGMLVESVLSPENWQVVSDRG